MIKYLKNNNRRNFALLERVRDFLWTNEDSAIKAFFLFKIHLLQYSNAAS